MRKGMWVLCMILVLASRRADAGPPAGDTGHIVRVSDCGPFIMHFPERNRKMSSRVEELLCEALPAIASETGLVETRSIEVYIVSGREDMVRLSGGSLPEWGEAFSDMRRGIMAIDASRVIRTPRPLRTVVTHELSHLVLAQKVDGARCPTWFVEGLAMRQSREWTLLDQWDLMTGVWTGRLPDLEDLASGFPAPASSASSAYKLSYAAVEALFEERPGDLVTLLSFTAESGDFERAFELTFGEGSGDFIMRFHLGLEKRYGAALPLLRSPPFWLILTALFLLTYVLKRIRTRRKMSAWEEE